MFRTIEWDPDKNISTTRHPSATHPAHIRHPTQPPLKCLNSASFLAIYFINQAGLVPTSWISHVILPRIQYSVVPQPWESIQPDPSNASSAPFRRILPIHTQYHRRIDTDRQPSRYPNWLSLNNLVPTVNSISRSGRFYHSAHPLIAPHLFGLWSNPVIHDAMRTGNPLSCS